jgi:hypothetical protein
MNKKEENKEIRDNHQISGEESIKKGEVKPSFNLEDVGLIGGLTVPKKNDLG